VTQHRSVSDIAFPSKIVTYLAAGRPVIASVNPTGEVAGAMLESEAGMVVTPESPEALLAAILALRNQDLKQRRENAREYAGKRWSSERVLGDLERSLRSVAESSASDLAEEGTTR
jgi:colanic acid biosynthesis glycosyl transferase WcaI